VHFGIRHADDGCSTPQKTGQIIVVDDDASIRRLVAEYFDEQNIPTSAASNRRDLNRQLARAYPSLIILDLRLGDEDGLDLLRDIRSHSNVPVIIMSGHYVDETDRVVGLELGADDFILKPFGLRELLARVRAILRRQEIGRNAKVSEPGGYNFNGWHLELSSRTLIDFQGAQVSLSKGEYALLLAFLKAPQRLLSREHLIQATRAREDIFDRSIDVQVCRLRRKLKRDPRTPRAIQAERGFGYVFVLPVEPY
jgi:two-component system, OmpR family, response regulator